MIFVVLIPKTHLILSIHNTFILMSLTLSVNLLQMPDIGQTLFNIHGSPRIHVHLSLSV